MVRRDPTVTMPDPSLTGPAKTNYLGETGATIAPKRRCRTGHCSAYPPHDGAVDDLRCALQVRHTHRHTRRCIVALFLPLHG